MARTFGAQDAVRDPEGDHVEHQRQPDPRLPERPHILAGEHQEDPGDRDEVDHIGRDGADEVGRLGDREPGGALSELGLAPVQAVEA